MTRREFLIKSASLVMAILVAGNIVGMKDSRFNGNGVETKAVINGSVVYAAEASLFTGDYTYVQNDAKNPNPAVVPQADGSVAVAMFNGTIVQVNCANGIVPKVISSAGVTASATANGIAIAATTVGSGIVQVQDTVTGKTSVIAVNVVAGAGAAQPTQQSTQVASAAYSYADSHKVVSSDGLLELNLDTMTYASSTTAFTPKIYYGADGILTMEAWGGQTIHIPVVVHKESYELAGSMLYPEGGNNLTDCKGFVGKVNGVRRIGVSGYKKGNNILYHYSIKQVGKQNVANATDLPIRVITLDNRDSAHPNNAGEQPIALTTK